MSSTGRIKDLKKSQLTLLDPAHGIPMLFAAWKYDLEARV